MKKKILILFSIITLLCSGCGLSTVYTDMPATIDEGLDDKTSDIVGAWYGRDGDISGIYYMYSNGIGEVIAFKHNHKSCCFFSSGVNTFNCLLAICSFFLSVQAVLIKLRLFHLIFL